MAGGAQQQWDIAVVGGGIVGLSAALELQARGRRVVVIDRDRPRAQASFGNGGVISRGSVLTVASPFVWRSAFRYASNRDPAVRIRWGSAPAFARWLGGFLPACNEAMWRRAALALSPLTAAAFEHHARLAERVGTSSRLRRTGYLKLYRTEAGFRSAGLEREVLEAAGVRAEPLDAAGVRDLEPDLAPFARGLFFPESGSVDGPGELVEACRAAFLRGGGAWRAGEVLALDHGEAVVAVRMQHEALSAAAVVVAAGVESSGLLRPLGYRLPMAAERGYHRHFTCGRGELRRPVHDVEGAYAASPVGGEVRLLSGIELARHDDPPDAAQLMIAEARARTKLPLGEAVAGPVWMGSRPSIADGLPVICRAVRHPRLLLAFGHGHIGFSTGPLTGRIVADLETGEAPAVPLAPLAVERFG